MKTVTAVLILLLTATLFITNTFAQQVVTMPDADLRAAVREALNLAPGTPITTEAMRNLTELSARSQGITDLAGLEHAVHMKSLFLDSTAVSDVSALANLTQLKMLSLYNTAVSDVSALANLTQLELLYLYNTAVSDVSALANLTQLTWLDLRSTLVSDVSALANLTQLTWLDLRSTLVSDVSALANLTQLTWLYLNHTAVSDVSALANLTQLQWLFLENCPLNAAAYQTHIPAIQANGTEVSFDPFKPIKLSRVPWIVSLVYFRPSDRPVRPNVDAEIDGLIKKAQRFFADQLELQGFGRKTFQFETDANGNAVVHHVNGKYPSAHYVQNRGWSEEIHEQILVPPKSIVVYMLDSGFPEAKPFTRTGGVGWYFSNNGGGAAIDRWHWRTIAHEIAHACGLKHDWRTDAKAKRIKTFTGDTMLTSFCAAEWLSVHPAFNPGQAVSTKSTTIEWLPPIRVSPNTLRLRFEVTDPDGLHQAQLQIPDFVQYSGQYTRLLDCRRLNGVRGTVGFVTNQLIPEIKEVSLRVIDVRGHMSGEYFPIDIPALLPPPKVVTLPDANLTAAVQESLSLSASEALTTHNIFSLARLEAPNRGITDLTGLEHAVRLKVLDLGAEYVSGEGYVNSNGVTDFSPLETLTNLQALDLRSMSNLVDASALAHLTQLRTLYLNDTAVSDVSALANLTQLKGLYLRDTGVSDVSVLANLTHLQRLHLENTAVSDVSALVHLTQLQRLHLENTAVSDVSPLLGLDLRGISWDSIGLRLESCPLSYASIHTHIPALQAKGIEVEFDNVAHPALLKVAGDGQTGTGGTALPQPFVVAAMDEYGQPMGGVPVQFEMLRGGGTLSANTVQTDARGNAQVTLTLGGTAGINKVKATSEGIRSWVLFNAVATEAAPQLAADVNGDGLVDLADLAIGAQAMGKPVENPRADVNGDGVVDGEDVAQVAARLGEGEAAAPSSTALPAGFTREKGEWALNLLHAENTGSPAFRRGIVKLEGFLALLVPEKTLLLANYPNPFNPETWIPYQLANPAEVTVTIYAANGAVVRTLALGPRRAGSYASQSRAAYWDGRNETGERVASGVYFYTLSAGDFSATRKMVIRK